MKFIRKARPSCSRGWTALFVLLLVAALADQAQADPYVPDVTIGDLQVVCYGFRIDNQAVLRARCNQMTGNDVYTIVEASIDLSSEVGNACMDGLLIRETETAVHLDAECDIGDEIISDSADLNDLIEGVAAEKQFRWKAGYGPGT